MQNTQKGQTSTGCEGTKMEVKLRAASERYEIYDTKVGNVTSSLTFLKPGQETRGHSHPHEETYFFISGNGILRIDGEARPVHPKESVVIPADKFHQVMNGHNDTLVFLCVWQEQEDSK